MRFLENTQELEVYFQSMEIAMLERLETHSTIILLYYYYSMFIIVAAPPFQFYQR